jgi:hypothetical protein
VRPIGANLRGITERLQTADNLLLQTGQGAQISGYTGVQNPRRSRSPENAEAVQGQGERRSGRRGGRKRTKNGIRPAGFRIAQEKQRDVQIPGMNPAAEGQAGSELPDLFTACETGGRIQGNGSEKPGFFMNNQTVALLSVPYFLRQCFTRLWRFARTT